MSYINKYEAYLKEAGINYYRNGDMLFREYNQIIIPLGPIVRDKPNFDTPPKSVFKKLKGKLLWWSYFEKGTPDNNWYGVIKDRHLEIADYSSSNTRNQIRKGLKNCEIRKVDANLVLENGYAIYKEAFKNYNQKPISKENYLKNILAAIKFEDIIHYWGVFNNNNLIGYAVVYCYEKLEANISEIRIDPKFNKLYPSYALFHVLSNKYLNTREFDSISDGYKTLLHSSNVQSLLLKKFGFKKVYLKLNIAFRGPYGVIQLIYPLIKAFSRLSNSFAAIIQLIGSSKKRPLKNSSLNNC